ncbi:MAG: long-chain fatty acid--CoA ligase [Pseudomonadota bacterium]|nr:long-chain fatty acid--CoA ligase [Pseudomonadota bacterium]
MTGTVVDFQRERNLPTMFFAQAARLGNKPFLWGKGDGGAFTPVTWAAAAAQVRDLARGLRALGVGAGDKVALVAENRPEWLLADLAVMAAGAITVPTYTTNTVDDHAYIFEHAEAKAVIVSSAALAARVLPAAGRAGCALVISLDPAVDGPAEGPRVLSWAAVAEAGGGDDFDVDAAAASLDRDAVCCFIYTSGTGGRPKGVMLSHRAILANCHGALEVLRELGVEDEIYLSLLPLSHAYEHTVGLYFPIGIGAQVYYSGGPDGLSQELAEVRPTLMTAVPRLYEVLHDRITRGVARAGGVQAALFQRAVTLGRKAYGDPASLSFGERLVNGFLTLTVRRKVGKRFGGRLKAFVSGGAALNPDIGTFFLALGVRLLQGYGQTEAAPVISVNPAARIKIHTVGKALAGVEVKIAEDGEILVRGPLLMDGYWRDQEATAAAIVDGWLHTGDIGQLDDEGYLEITDRKKDIIVNAGGDNIAPAKVEGRLTFEPEIAQAMVVGDKSAYLVAVLVPDEECIAAAAKAAGVPPRLADLTETPELRAALTAAVGRANESLSTIERVRHFIVAETPFTTDNGLMTPTLKTRRHAINAVYGDRLQALYG